MQHFVITRFNIRSAGKEQKIRAKDSWLADRFDLFETYCLPSMKAQTNRAFRWVIFFDDQTPESFRNRIEACQQLVPFEAIFVGPMEMTEVTPFIRSRLDAATDRVITTRLDNDDAVSSDFIACIQAEAAHCAEDTVIDFFRGLSLFRKKFFHETFYLSPFSSLVEDVASLKTVWATQHTKLGELFKVRVIDDKPYWIQVVHGLNVSNRAKGKLARQYDFLDRFPGLPASTYSAPTASEILHDRAIAGPVRLARETAVKLGKRLKSA